MTADNRVASTSLMFLLDASRWVVVGWRSNLSSVIEVSLESGLLSNACARDCLPTSVIWLPLMLM